jgi:hypothetical protein
MGFHGDGQSLIPSDPWVALPCVAGKIRGDTLEAGWPGTNEVLWNNTWNCLCPWMSSCPLGAGQQKAAKEAEVFRVSPSSGLLAARPTNAPPTSITMQVFFTAR